MNPAELRKIARQLIERSCREQNIPLHVEDPSVLAEVAALLIAQREIADGGEDPARRWRRKNFLSHSHEGGGGRSRPVSAAAGE